MAELTDRDQRQRDGHGERSPSVNADDLERVTVWALRQIGVDDAREQCMADERCRRYAALFHHATTVREAAPTDSDERWQLTNAMFSAELAFRRYVNTELRDADE